MSIFPSWRRHNGLHLSQDGRQFKELTLEDGTWNYFCANDQGALSVYSPNAHETSLRVGNFFSTPRHDIIGCFCYAHLRGRG